LGAETSPATTTGEDVHMTSSGDGAVGVSVNSASGTAADATEQAVSASVLPGTLTINPSTDTTSFTKVSGGAATSSLSMVTVDDARGSLVGWRATVSLRSVVGVSANELAAAQLCVSPNVPTTVAVISSEVKPGQRACANAGGTLTLFYAPPGGGGGTSTDTASLTLLLAGVAGAGPVTATLAVAVG
jgi:hypothetical protein